MNLIDHDLLIIADIPVDDESLIISVADYMYCLGEHFARRMMAWEYSFIERLYGFPIIPIWSERALNSSDARQLALRYQIAGEIDYLHSLPESSRKIYHSAMDKIT
jgi:hypothetical protein